MKGIEWLDGDLMQVYVWPYRGSAIAATRLCNRNSSIFTSHPLSAVRSVITPNNSLRSSFLANVCSCCAESPPHRKPTCPLLHANRITIPVSSAARNYFPKISVPQHALATATMTSLPHICREIMWLHSKGQTSTRPLLPPANAISNRPFITGRSLARPPCPVSFHPLQWCLFKFKNGCLGLFQP